MELFTLTEISDAFAASDGFDPANYGSYLKDMRNLTQRSPLPPSLVRGRTFFYSLPRITTIRVAQLLTRFGHSRDTISLMCHSMLQMQNGATLDERYLTSLDNDAEVYGVLLEKSVGGRGFMLATPPVLIPLLSGKHPSTVFHLSMIYRDVQNIMGKHIQRVVRSAKVGTPREMTLGGVEIPNLPTTATLNFQNPSEGV